MKVLSEANKTAKVELSSQELLAAANALNEVLHGIDVPEFQTRLGVSREDAEVLLDDLGRLFDRLEGKPPTRGWR